MKEVLKEKTGNIHVFLLLSLFHPHPPAHWILTPIPPCARDRGERRKKSPGRHGREAARRQRRSPTFAPVAFGFERRPFPRSPDRRDWWLTGGQRREAQRQPGCLVPSPAKSSVDATGNRREVRLTFFRLSGFSGRSRQRVSVTDLAPEILWQPAQTCGPLSR